MSKNRAQTGGALEGPNSGAVADIAENSTLDVVHFYDGHERVRGSGSVPDVVWSLATRSAAQGHDVTIVERQWEDLPLEAEHRDVTFHRLPLRTGATKPWERIPYEMVTSPTGATRLFLDRMNFAFRGLQYLRKHDPDVVHVHLPFAANVIATLSPSLASRMVYTAHIGETEKRISNPRFSPDVHLARRAAKTIALNPKARRAFIDRGADDERVEVIPNGVDITRFDDVEPEREAEVRAEYDVDADNVVLFVGTITPRKGVVDLVEAVANVPDDAQFVLIGNTDLEPGYVDDVRETIASEGVEDRIILIGFIPEEHLLAFYSLADVFVLPSYEEGSSIAVTEAMAAGLPVVGSKIDGIKQQVDHGVHGLLTPPGDTRTLAKNLSCLIGNEERRVSMERSIKERADKLAWEHITEQVLDVYREVN